MYSYEDRIRAVRLYIKLGKRTGPTIGQWVTRQRMLSRAGIGNSNKVAICRLAMCAQRRSILTSRDK